MSRNFKSYNNRRNDLYIPPFRKFQSVGFTGDVAVQHTGRRYDQYGGGSPSRGGGPNSSGGSSSGGNRRFDGNRGDFNQKGPTRFEPYKNRPQRGGRNNRKNRHRNDRQYDLNHLDHQWFKIQIPFGKKLGKDWIFNAINGVLDVPFNPYGFYIEGNAAAFYLDSSETANAVRAKSKCIQTPEGSKMTLIMGRSPPPNTVLNSEVQEKLKIAMSNRFTPETNVLSLNQFHKDSDLRKEGIFLPLTRPRVFDTIVKVIKDNIPQLVGLDLSGNRLSRLTLLASLVECKNLKSLSLKNNNIIDIKELNYLKGMGIEELILDENPMCDGFTDQATYISQIREKFPKVVKLDGQDLPAPIVFDLGSEESIPPKKGSFFPSVDAQQLIVQFLESYFCVYDSMNRQGLLDAYHNNAVYSISTYKLPLARLQSTGLQTYFTVGRNLLQRGSEEAQRTNLKEGKLEIVAFLNKLPQSSHDPKSMTVDVAHVSPTLMMFNVMGVFKEVSSEDSSNPLRNFSRSFSVVPAGDKGISIVNDIHFVGNATTEQIKAFKAVPVKDESPATDQTKLAQQLSEVTGMNLPFSVRCLEENNWDLHQALSVFNQLKVDGCIPPEAFEK